MQHCAKYLFILAAIGCWLGAHRASAAPPLRWSFVPDQQLNYAIDQQMTQQITFSGGNETAHAALRTSSETKIELSWQVADVNDDGSARLIQTLRRVQLRMITPGLTVELDSATGKSPTGPAAMLTPLLNALLEHPVELTVASHGEIQSLQIPDELTRTIKNSPGALSLRELATSAGLRMLIRQALIRLPADSAELAPGFSWEETVAVPDIRWDGSSDEGVDASPAKIEMSFRYEGQRDEGESELAVIVPNITLSIPPASEIVVESQNTQGEIRFHLGEQRLESADIERTTVLMGKAGGQPFRQEMEQASRVRWETP